MSDDRADGRDPENGGDSSVAPQPASAAARRERRADASRPAGRAERTRATATAKDRGGRGGSPPARLVRFLREVIAELRKVIWPTRKELVTYTGVVLVFVAFMVTFVWLLDLGFQRAVFYVFG